MDEKALLYLSETARAGTLRGAADRLDLNVSTLSRQIARLEETLGIAVLERDRQGARLTDAGRLLVEHVRQNQAQREDLLTRIGQLRGVERGMVNVVLGEGFVGDLVEGALEGFCRAHPGITLSLALGGTNEVMRRVGEDEAHLGLVYNPPADARIATRLAVAQPMAVIMAPGHALAGGEGAVSLAEAAAAPLALMEQAYGTRQFMALAEAATGLAPAPALTTNAIAVLKHYVAAGLGVTFLPVFAVRAEITAGTLATRALALPLPDNTAAHLVFRRGRRLPPAAERLARHMAAGMAAFAPVSSPA